MASPSELRKHRIRRVVALHDQGLTSAQIGRRLGIAPTTVRDYLNDPLRQQARKRQRVLAVRGVELHGHEVENVSPKWKRGGPHRGKGAQHEDARARQLRAIIGSRVRRGRR